MYKKTDVHLTYELAANTIQIILDENLNKETLTVQESKWVINVSYVYVFVLSRHAQAFTELSIEL